jgi:hypothetical protein
MRDKIYLRVERCFNVRLCPERIRSVIALPFLQPPPTATKKSSKHMKLILLFSVVLLSCNSYAQINPDSITGKWLKTPKEDLIIEVYRSNDEYKGKISWSKDPAKPVGFIILEGLKFDAKTMTWKNGKIHSPSGSHYSGTAKINASGVLEVFGYKSGLRFLGRKKYFKRVK